MGRIDFEHFREPANAGSLVPKVSSMARQFPGTRSSLKKNSPLVRDPLFLGAAPSIRLPQRAAPDRLLALPG